MALSLLCYVYLFVCVHEYISVHSMVFHEKPQQTKKEKIH